MDSKLLPVGKSDFKKLIEDQCYFVDKTLFIKEIVETPGEVLLLHRPRRFGKTLNMSMLKYYFDMKEPDTEKLFSNFAVWKEDGKCAEWRNKFPVIFITLKEAKGKSWDACILFSWILIVTPYS